jgi:hypothetical protein
MKFNQLSQVLGSFLLLAGATSLLGQSFISAPVKTFPVPNLKKSLLVEADGIKGCPDGFDLYVRRVAPKVSKDAKLPAAQGDFQSFFYLAEGQLLKSTPEVGFVPACFQVK